MLAIWSLVPLPFLKTSLNIWKFTVHVLLKPGLENFEHYFTSVWDECNCAVVWAFFGTVFLWDWNEKWPSSVLWPLLSIPNLLPYWVQHFHSIILKDLKKLNWNSITSTTFVRSAISKAHLTSHSRMSGSRWMITPSWLSGSWRSFLCSSSVYSFLPHLLNIFCLCYAHTISVLHMKCSLGISYFLEEMSSLSHSMCFLDTLNNLNHCVWIST